MIFFKTPEFWYEKPNIFLRLLLKPISFLYKMISDYRYNLDYDITLSDKKVIAVGGITAGGSGKTVVVNSICNILKKKGKSVAVLSRGYGRSSNKSLKVDNSIHTYKDVGDEPLLLSKQCDVFVGKDRAKTSDLAENFEYLVLDDGVTQKYLKPNKKFLVISNSQQFGNGELLPLGPNRLDFDTIKSDIDAIFIIRTDEDEEKNYEIFKNIPVFYGRTKQNFKDLSGRLMVFCGLGYPQKFFRIFSNFEVAKTVTFPDHYPYKDSDMKMLFSEAFRLHAQLVTTEKDLMRIPAKYRDQIKTVGIDIEWERPIDSLLDF